MEARPPQANTAGNKTEVTSTSGAESAREGQEEPRFDQAPSISLPQGGGAVRGIGEKFNTNVATGTGSLAVPVPTSPGRQGFGPQLSLSYDSGASNGPFGFGWRLSLPSITRKTDKGLPRYDDASDEFVLSGVEELVPVLHGGKKAARDEGDFRVYAYRPRTEGFLARIERWQHKNGAVHWRSITRDNVLNLYGRTKESRIVNPDDETRVFSWLLSESRDDKGNAIVYEYKAENNQGVLVEAAHEAHRATGRRSAQRYLKRVRYGNRKPWLNEQGRRPREATQTMRQTMQAMRDATDWMFELVLDYGEHDQAAPEPDEKPDQSWEVRQDSFSTYRAGFEVRTYRLCKRLLMFHHFPDEKPEADGLVRSLSLVHAQTPRGAFVASCMVAGHRRKGNGYDTRPLPPLTFAYSQAVPGTEVKTLDPDSAKNLRGGLAGNGRQIHDLDGEGLPGVLLREGDTWSYKRNVSALAVEERTARLAPLEALPDRPSVAGPGWRFMDIDGSGHAELVSLAEAGFHERTRSGWGVLQRFETIPVLNWDDPDLRFVDLTGDGRADILITRGDHLLWHPSLGRAGFGEEHRDAGPKVVSLDRRSMIALADLSGDGLSDLVRIRHGEVCYWPNLGYGRFGAKVTMDNAPVFDHDEQFDPARIRLADIDGSGVTDLIYLGREDTRFWYNHLGNGWSQQPNRLAFPTTDDVSAVETVDLLGTGTACLVWSSPLPGDAGTEVRYVELMAEGKPHLLTGVKNNMGAETRIRYTPSTHFYLKDKYDGKPWVTKLPMPVHVVERVETIDHVSGNRFTTRYAYHHGHYDGVEREFCGFGRVDQWDTEEMAAVVHKDREEVTNADPTHHVPPVLTKTWFHTGAFLDREDLAAHFLDEYYREPAWITPQIRRKWALPDTVLPAGLSLEEEREACRALKGSMLHREVYGLDGTEKEAVPYVVAEQSFTVRLVQAKREGDGENRHPVFLRHASEAITYTYDRDLDPRVQHALTLEVDDFGNVLKQAEVAYGRRASPLADADDKAQQETALVTYTEKMFTEDLEKGRTPVDPRYPDDHRVPQPAETRTYELTGFPMSLEHRYVAGDFVEDDPDSGDPPRKVLVTDGEPLDYEKEEEEDMHHRLVEHVRTLYRPDDLWTDDPQPRPLMAFEKMEPRAIPGRTYKLALTPGILAQFRARDGTPLQPDPATVLGGGGPAGGGYILGQDLVDKGLFPAGPDGWWLPSGEVFYDAAEGTPAAETASAVASFFLPRRFRDPFHDAGHATEAVVGYDPYLLAPIESVDALGNRVTVGERLPGGSRDPASPGMDYRVLQPTFVTDPNGNRTEVAFDVLGLVVGMAVMGKQASQEGDNLSGFVADLTDAQRDAHFQDPLAPDPGDDSRTPLKAHTLLKGATVRFVYDLTRQPAAAATIRRETHVSDLAQEEAPRLQHSLAYFDGLGREIQARALVDPGPLAPGEADVDLRWVVSGWVVFNNKGQPVRKYEPFFSNTHAFGFEAKKGVSPTLFYDPAGRVVATVHPDGSYEKVVVTPWRQETWDRNDTVLLDPDTDPHVGAIVATHIQSVPDEFQPWRDRQPGADGQDALTKTEDHAATPSVGHLDPRGRPFLSVANAGSAASPRWLRSRVRQDIQDNEREVRDAAGAGPRGRPVMRYAYDMLGNRILSDSMDAGRRWILADVAGNPLISWDERGHVVRTEYDLARRPVRVLVRGADAADPNRQVLTQRLVYGEQMTNPEANNLRGRLCQHFDQAGVAATLAFDFKGNPTNTLRRLVRDHENVVDWRTADQAITAAPAFAGVVPAAEPQLEADAYEAASLFDALDRPHEVTHPHRAGQAQSRQRSTFNQGGLLETVAVNVGDERAQDGSILWRPFVTGMAHDAHGRRERIDHGNGVHTTYEYDPETFRLTRLCTHRHDHTGRCRENAAGRLQDLRYTYDPVGNITRLRDEAQQGNFFGGHVVDAVADHTYDAVYRLVSATGREHLTQAFGPHGPGEIPAATIPFSSQDESAVGDYMENYFYDDAGNLERMEHWGAHPSYTGWQRTFQYAAPGLTESGTASNRLTTTAVGVNNPQSTAYSYDAHGNMTRMPHLTPARAGPNMHWDHADRLKRVDLPRGPDGFPGVGHYTYDAEGQRVRKVTRRAAGRTEERIYLGGLEVFRVKNALDIVTLERETLHVMDDQGRIALVETRTKDLNGTDKAPQQQTRCQFSNHLQSAHLELDENGAIVSYEEYTPYGSTSYRAVRSELETPKRYRYTGKERDEESGLYYHGARYYAPWLARWTACDPAGLVDGPNVYLYVSGNPVMLHDPSGTQEHRPPTQEEHDNQRSIDYGEQNVVPRNSSSVPKVNVPQTKADWTRRALEVAGIDISRWKPERGFTANQEIVKKVYTYYAQLYTNDSNLRWAGMAKLAGGEVWRGLQIAQQDIDALSNPSNFVDPMGGSGARLGQAIVASQAAKLQTRFLEMQKDIFLDLAWQHQAYVEGGILALEQATVAGAGDTPLAAWYKISSGNNQEILEGNKQLLKREQQTVLAPHYKIIQDYTDGDIIPLIMSRQAQSPVPGGKPFRQLVPNGDLTIFDDRWKWISNDMLPAYTKMDAKALAPYMQMSLEQLSHRPWAKKK